MYPSLYIGKCVNNNTYIKQFIFDGEKLTVLRSGVGDNYGTQKHEKQSGAGHDQSCSPRTCRDGRVFVYSRLVHHVLIISW